MRHIVHIIADGEPGGGTTFVLGLSSDLAKTGEYVVSLITAPNSYAYQSAQSANITPYGIDFFTSRFDPRLSFKLRNLIGRLSPDLVHVHGARGALPFTYGPLARTTFPVVYTVHGFHFLKKKPLMRWAGKLSEKRIAKRVDHVCFVSNSDQCIARENSILGPASNSVIYNGIDTNDAFPIPSNARIYDLAFVGRMVPQKNPLFVIDVMKALRDEKLTLLMVGGGELEGQVKEYARECKVDHLVTFTGALSRRATMELLGRARVCIFPSLWEGLPITPMESMALEVPVVASNVGGTSEVVSDQDTGILVDGFDPNEYAAEIRSLLRDPTRRHAFSHEGRKRVDSLFQRETSSRRYLELYAAKMALKAHGA